MLISYRLDRYNELASGAAFLVHQYIAAEQPKPIGRDRLQPFRPRVAGREFRPPEFLFVIAVAPPPPFPDAWTTTNGPATINDPIPFLPGCSPDYVTGAQGLPKASIVEQNIL